MTMSNIREIKSRHTPKLMAINGVVGVGIGLLEGEEVIQVMVAKKTPRLLKKIPGELEGIRINVIETGEIRAL